MLISDRYSLSRRTYVGPPRLPGTAAGRLATDDAPLCTVETAVDGPVVRSEDSREIRRDERAAPITRGHLFRPLFGVFRFQLFPSPSGDGEYGRCDEDKGYKFLAEAHV